MRRIKHGLSARFLKLEIRFLAVLLLAHFTLTYWLMRYFEPADSALRELSTFAWYYVVTGTTVGYGDFSPATPGGRVVGIVVMFGTIGVAATVLSALASRAVDYTQRRRRGELSMKHLSGHTVLLFGSFGNEVKNLIAELQADKSNGRSQIVLCLSGDDSNPLPEKVDFVRVRHLLSATEVMEQANIAEASFIIINGATDEKTLATAISVMRFANQRAHVVVYLDSSDYIDHIRSVSDRIEIVKNVTDLLLAQATHDRGSSQAVATLLSNRSAGTIYREDIPDIACEWLYGDLHNYLLRVHKVNVISVLGSNGTVGEHQIVPNPDQVIRGGMALFYLAADRVSIPWENLKL